MSAACVAALPAQIAGASIVQTGMVPRQGKAGALVLDCPQAGAARPDAQTRKVLDDKLVCTVMCCCNQYPAVGAEGQNLKQACASAALEGADKLMGWHSRYKPEVSYDMTADEPRPLMHRDASGADTTQRSGYWIGRAFSEIENFAGGRGQVRRPDLVIVKDPCLPPTPDNIERVVEMKFGRDRRDEQQDKAYAEIAGGEKKYAVFGVGRSPRPKDEHACNCDVERPKEQPAPVLMPSPVPESDWSNAGKVFGYGALTVLGAVATVVAVLSPFDGPLGDAAAGAGTLAAASRAAAAWRALYPVAAAGVP